MLVDCDRCCLQTAPTDETKLTPHSSRLNWHKRMYIFKASGVFRNINTQRPRFLSICKDYRALLSMPFSEHFAETRITRRVVINVPQLQYKHSGGTLFHAQSADFWQDHHCRRKECCVYYFPAQSTPVISHPGPNLTQVVLIIKTCCVFD